MTASTPSRTPSIDPSPDRPTDGAKEPRKAPSGPLEKARAAARKLLGRDRDKSKKDDPNIYPLF